MIAGPSLRLACLMFHEVADDPTTTGFQRPSAAPYRHRPAAFARYLEAIAASGAAPARVEAAERDDCVLLTFDDGGASALAAADMLEARGWFGHFFIVSGLLDAPCFLSRSAVRELHARGHAIGSHSHSHPDVFRRLPRPRMDDEWRRSRAMLEDATGAAVTTASIPGGHGDAATERAAAAAGYAVLFTSEPRLTPWRRDGMLCVGRVCPKAGTSAARVAALACGRGWSRELWSWRAKSLARRWLDAASATAADGAAGRG